jgi:hypothetical protein
MRMLCLLFLTLTACTSARVRCDGHLQRINPPAATAGAAAAMGVGTAVGAALPRDTP